MHPFIYQHQSAIAELCRRYCVQRLEVFGSAARGTDFAPESSDADFLVEFLPSADSPTLKAFFGLQAGLPQILGRAVDLAEFSAPRTTPMSRLASIEAAKSFMQRDLTYSRDLIYSIAKPYFIIKPITNNNTGGRCNDQKAYKN